MSFLLSFHRLWLQEAWISCICISYLQNAGSAAIASEIQRAPLPNFDGTVLKRLKANEPELVWNLMLRQAASYYYAGWPDIEDSSIYRIIGQKMMADYPAIKQEGANSWVSIENC